MAAPEAKGVEVEFDFTPTPYLFPGDPNTGGVEIDFPGLAQTTTLQANKPAIAGIEIEFIFPTVTEKQKMVEAGTKRNIFTAGNKDAAPLSFD